MTARHPHGTDGASRRSAPSPAEGPRAGYPPPGRAAMDPADRGPSSPVGTDVDRGRQPDASCERDGCIEAGGDPRRLGCISTENSAWSRSSRSVSGCVDDRTSRSSAVAAPASSSSRIRATRRSSRACSTSSCRGVCRDRTTSGRSAVRAEPEGGSPPRCSSVATIAASSRRGAGVGDLGPEDATSNVSFSRTPTVQAARPSTSRWMVSDTAGAQSAASSRTRSRLAVGAAPRVRASRLGAPSNRRISLRSGPPASPSRSAV